MQGQLAERTASALALKNPTPDLLRQICTALGLKVLSMKRIRIGGVPMAKLPSGQWRYLGEKERF